MGQATGEDGGVNLHSGVLEKRGEPPGQGQALVGLTEVPPLPLWAVVGQLSVLQGRAVS